MSAAVVITEFTDPGCPWAYSAEPFRRRLEWLYGEHLEFQARMVVLSDSPADYEARGFTPAKQASAFASIAADHHMPIDTRERPRMTATRPACETVVAVRLNGPDGAWRKVLRALRISNFAGELFDEEPVIDKAVVIAGLDPETVREWRAADETAAALAQDMALAREPMPAARVLDEKLANWSGGRRYTCPSYEIARIADGTRIAVPGFQPFGVYDVITANLVPGLHRREPAATVEECIEWADCPLATQEVALLRDIPFHQAREELGRVATEIHVGADGFWTLG